MKIQTMSVVVGNRTCNAHCPFCVSRMTPNMGISESPAVNLRNFHIGLKYAANSGVSTILFTGKGEPTLFPYSISSYLKHLTEYEYFPFKELQTNGMALNSFWSGKSDPSNYVHGYESYLHEWYDLGLTTIAISVVHWQDDMNKKIYNPSGEYFNLANTVDELHRIGFSVRLSCMMLKGYVDDPVSVTSMISFAKKHKVEQLTIRPIKRPESVTNGVGKFVEQHTVNPVPVEEFLNDSAVKLMELMHGGVVYDFDGQNICLTDCLTLDATKKDELRQLIFFPDGHLRYDWRYEGATIL